MGTLLHAQHASGGFAPPHVEREAYAEFQPLANLPDTLIDSPKASGGGGFGGASTWHNKCMAGRLSEGDLRRLQNFKDKFVTVRTFFHVARQV